MIDIHSHILPGLDDGSSNLEESVAMLRMAAESGTTDMVASPHANLEHAFDPALVESKIAELLKASEGVVRIHYGCDFHLYFDNVQDALVNPSKYSINHKNYVLVEPSELMVFQSTEDVLERMRAAGMAVIITHPERNGLLQRGIDKLESWVAGGSYLQLTAQSLFGRFGKQARRFSEELLRRGLAHFVASDAHDTQRRPPRLDEAYAWIAREYGEAMAERLLVSNPAAVLSGEPLPVGKIESVARHRSWWGGFR
jgi:protein-tyrosine phosphatase